MIINKNLHFYQINMIISFLNSYLRKKIYIEHLFYIYNKNKKLVFLLFQRFYRLKQVVCL